MARRPRKTQASDMRMEDIAKMAGVAKSTVSRALADSDQVSASTKARIRQIASEYNYRLNVAARDFRLQQTRTVKVMVPLGAAGLPMFTDPFVMELTASLADTLSERNYNMLLSKIALSSPEMIRDAFDTRNVEGLIVIGQRRFHNDLNEMAQSKVPLVVWGAHFPDQLYCTVGSDNVAGARRATEHLLKLGRRRIAFLGDCKDAEPNLRFDGYRSALERAGVGFDESLVIPTAYDRLAGHAAVSRHIEDGLTFDAVFGTNDLLAMSAISALHDHGLNVPSDVAVVGYDDITLASYFSPALTTIRQDISRASQLLVDKALSMIAGENAESETLPTELVIRKSCGAMG